jgi:phosphoribosylformylglycinamidine cyclo-ligase
VPSRSGSYRSAGVDIDAADAAKDRIAERVGATHGVSVLRGVGLFGGFFRAPRSDGSVVLVSSADSVGTKVLLAALAGRHRGIGIDLVNHCVNDILACGATPLFFLDYYATPKLNPNELEEIVDGLAEACEAANCALVGGETAQLPGIYQQDAYDLAGFIVGEVDENRIVDGSGIRAGDVVIGLASNGLHTNGFTLARSALGLSGSVDIARDRLEASPVWDDRTLGEILLTPHRSYLNEVSPLLDRGMIRGMAHITGGGIVGNLARIVPGSLTAVIDVTSWERSSLFREIQRQGDIDDDEMYRVFNMGIGFVIVARPDAVNDVLGTVPGSSAIGRVEPSADGPRVRLVGLTHGQDA